VKKDEVLAYYGTQRQLAQALGITQAAVAQWREVPMLRQYQLERLTGGRLKVQDMEQSRRRPSEPQIIGHRPGRCSTTY